MQVGFGQSHSKLCSRQTLSGGFEQFRWHHPLHVLQFTDCALLTAELQIRQFSLVLGPGFLCMSPANNMRSVK